MTLIEMIWWGVWVAAGSGIGWLLVRVTGHGDPGVGALLGGILGFIFSFFAVRLIGRKKSKKQNGR